MCDSKILDYFSLEKFSPCGKGSTLTLVSLQPPLWRHKPAHSVPLTRSNIDIFFGEEIPSLEAKIGTFVCK